MDFVKFTKISSIIACLFDLFCQQLILLPMNNSKVIVMSNEYVVKDSFAFAEEIVEQDPEFFMGSLDVDSLFTKIPLEEPIDIGKSKFIKIKFKELLSFARKESYFLTESSISKSMELLWFHLKV